MQFHLSAPLFLIFPANNCKNSQPKFFAERSGKPITWTSQAAKPSGDFNPRHPIFGLAEGLSVLFFVTLQSEFVKNKEQ